MAHDYNLHALPSPDKRTARAAVSPLYPKPKTQLSTQADDVNRDLSPFGQLQRQFLQAGGQSRGQALAERAYSAMNDLIDDTPPG
jgi:hypothetical protein